jgi:PTH1 family peptidyl-tRNA hydrolase
MKLIVGLGNPGEEYASTRHNMGFRVIDSILNTYNITLNKLKHSGAYVKTTINNTEVILLKPLTFMNNSGQSIREVMDYYKIDVKDIVVIYDDIDTDVGKLRVKLFGSAGTHNGLKSVIQHLNTDKFYRIRVGIGKSNIPLLSFVLGKPTKEDELLLEQSIPRAAHAAVDFLTIDFEKVISKYNG